MRISSLCAVIVLAGLLVSSPPAIAQVEITGEHTQGVRQIDLTTNSSKFNEYRDLRDGYSLEVLRLNAYDRKSHLFMDFEGRQLLRDDEVLRLRLGDLVRRWNVRLSHDEIPHRYSNKAMTPYIDRGNGLYTVPGRVGIQDDGIDSTGTPSLVPTAGQMAVNDELIAAYLATYLQPTRLATQRQRTDAAFQYSPSNEVRLGLGLTNARRTGTRSTYGPIGDRPPRTLNVEISEPIDQVSREVRTSVEYARRDVQARVSYQFSAFENDINDMRWQNLFLTPTTDADYVTTVPGTARNVTNYGQRALAPDNRAHTITLATGLTLPLDSRLTTTAAFSDMRQDEDLLPYSYSTLGGDLHPERGDGLDWNDPAKLPRRTADAAIRTLRIDLDYTISPARGLSVRPFARLAKLDNNTPSAEWRYVTQGTAGTNGDVNYRNYRRNLPYAYDKLRIGVDGRHYVSTWRTTVGLGYARESIDRDYREADTDEDIFEASIRSRPSRRVTLSAGYLRGSRHGESYDYNVTSQSYWYSFEQGAADVDNPQFLFANHPDLRKFDVSDRSRDEFNVGATYTARSDLDLSGAYRYRRDDFDSDVSPIAPLSGTTVPLPNPDDADALTPGRQLGVLKDTRQNLMADVNFTPPGRWAFRAHADHERVTSDQRGMVFNENQRREPSNSTIQTPTQLGPWTDADRLYEVTTEQTTNTVGLGATFEIVPGRLRLLSDYSLSRAKVDLMYTGYGSDPEYLGRDWETFQFGFDDPETARYHQYAVNTSLEYRPFDRLTFGLHYLFNRYRIQDWVKEPSGAWVEEVESENFYRDTSRDNRWGNRLISMGSYLAPSYEGHVGLLTTTYMF